MRAKTTILLMACVICINLPVISKCTDSELEANKQKVKDVSKEICCCEKSSKSNLYVCDIIAKGKCPVDKEHITLYSQGYCPCQFSRDED